MKKLLIILLGMVLFSHATTYKKTDFAKLVQTSTVIAEGEITSIKSAWQGKQISTTITLKVSKLHKGQSQSTEIEFIIQGGRVGDVEQHISGAPKFNIDEKVMVLLVWHRNHYWLHSMAMGKFDLKQEGNTLYLENPMMKNAVLYSQNLKTHSGNHPKFEYQQAIKLINELAEKRGD